MNDEMMEMTMKYLVCPTILNKLKSTPPPIDFVSNRDKMEEYIKQIFDNKENTDDIPKNIVDAFIEFVKQCNTHFTRLKSFNIPPHSSFPFHSSYANTNDTDDADNNDRDNEMDEEMDDDDDEEMDDDDDDNNEMDDSSFGTSYVLRTRR
jgi:hypothetical protein